MGKKAGQSKVSNKMNYNIRLTARALVRGAAFIKNCRNRWYLKYFKSKQVFYCETSSSIYLLMILG